ncbi:MAG: HAD family phosphatase [bacterium]
MTDLSTNIKAIIFDLDGVLIDSETGIEESFRQILKKHADFNLTSKLYKKYFLGRTDHEGFRLFAKSYPEISLPNLDKIMQDKYLAMIGTKITPYPQAEIVINQAAEQYSIALATNSQLWQVEALNQILPLSKYFPIITTSDEIKHSKPHPEIYLKTAAKMNKEPKDCVAIEDTVSGIQSAKSAGLICWAVAHTLPKKKLAKADRVFDIIGDINFN